MATSSDHTDYTSYAKIVKKAQTYPLEVLVLYGLIIPTYQLWFFGAKNNTKAQFVYEWTEIANHQPLDEAVPGGPLNMEDRERAMLRHLERLNHAIAFMEINSARLAEAYAERAFLAYEFRQDWICMYNILLAKAVLHFPCSLEQTLNALFRQAFDRGSGSFQPIPCRGVSEPLCFSNVSLRNTVLHGSYLLANRNLPKGLVLCKETPFVRLLCADHHLRCDYCLSYTPHILTPCQFCSRVLYCSLACNMHAFQEYHKFECQILGILRLEYTHLEQVAARITICVLQLFDGNLELFRKTMRQTPADMWRFCVPQKTAPGLGFHTYCSMVQNLSTNRSRMSQRELLHDAAKAIGLAKLIAGQMKNNDHGWQTALAEHVVKHLQIARTNALYLMRTVDDPEKTGTIHAASLPFAMILPAWGSMFNHSCVPNVEYSLEKDGTVRFSTNTAVERCKQLNINYGVGHTWPRYKFVCSCLKCVDQKTPSTTK